MKVELNKCAICATSIWKKYLLLLFGLAVLVMFSLSPVAAQQEAKPPVEPSTGPMQSLADLVNQAIEFNPKIEKARQDWRSVIEKYKIAVGLPDPQLMVTYFPEPIETRLGPQDWNASLAFKLPYPGKLHQKGQIAYADAEVARIQLNKTIRDVVVAVRESYHELNYIREAQRVAATNSDLLDHLRKVAETSHAENRGELIDVIRAQSQTGQIRYDQLLLADLEQAELASLNSLLNQPTEAGLGDLLPEKIQPLIYSLDEIYTLAEAHQEEIRIKTVQVERAASGVKLARSQNRPDFTFGLFYAGIGDPDVPAPPPDAGDDAFGVQFGVSIPLWFGQNGARVAGARAQKRAAQAELIDRINQTRADIRRLHFRLTTAERTFLLYRDELLPQALQSMSLAETWFREEQGSFSDFVEAQAIWYNFNLALERARADYGKFLARIEKTVGHPLTEIPPSVSKSEEAS